MPDPRATTRAAQLVVMLDQAIAAAEVRPLESISIPMWEWSQLVFAIQQMVSGEPQVWS